MNIFFLILCLGIGALSTGHAREIKRADACPSLESVEREILDRINAARAKPRHCGPQHYAAAGPVRWNRFLSEAARQHADDMSRHAYFSHKNRQGERASRRVATAGYDWNLVGENIGVGQTTVMDVVAAWLESPTHCSIIMNSEFVDLGAACSTENQAPQTARPYWALVMGAPR